MVEIIGLYFWYFGMSLDNSIHLFSGENCTHQAIPWDLKMSPLNVTTHQNLNSGNLLMNGRNSSFCFVGSAGPSSSEGRHQKKNQLSDANVTDDNKIISNAVLTWIIKQWGIHFWWEESNEEVKVVDPESICDYVPALIKDTNDSVHLINVLRWKMQQLLKSNELCRPARCNYTTRTLS